MATDSYQQQFLLNEKKEEADFVEPNQNQDYAIDGAGPSAPLFNVAVPPLIAVSAGQPVNTAFIQEVLPHELWPHNFIILSVILAVVLGIFNVLTLPLTICALTAAVQPNPNQDQAMNRAGPSVPYAPFNVDVPAGQPVNAAFFQEVLPPELWPHNFIILSIVLAIVLGILNVLTLPLTVIALTLAVLGRNQSMKGRYSTAKSFSKITIALLLFAVLFFAFGLFIGLFIPGLIVSALLHFFG